MEKKEGEYTNRLIKNLMKKYHVTIEMERLKNLDVNALDSALTDAKLITWDKGSVSEKQFVRQVRAQQRFRRKNKFNDDDFHYKEQVLGGIVSQTLTTLEGLERHYEKKPPFDAIFRFYTRHRLIKALEQKVFVPDVKVDDKAVQAFYNQNIKEFSRPGSYRLAVAEGSEKDLEKLWTEVITGGDFTALAQKENSHAFATKIVQEDKMDPVLKKAVAGLAQGEVSPVFAWNGRYGMVRLIQFTPSSVLPLAKVENLIDQQLRTDKMKDVRKVYLKKLRAAAAINVNDKTWRRLLKELQDDETTRN